MYQQKVTGVGCAELVGAFLVVSLVSVLFKLPHYVLRPFV